MDTWEFYLNYIAQSESLSEKQKEELFNGLTKLRQVFSNDWLQHAREQRHPLRHCLLNIKYLWAQFWLAEFGRKIHLLKGLPKFERLAKRLIQSKEFIGAEAEVEVAATVIDAGMTDVELYPQVKVNDKTKEPELKACVNEKDIYFEVTTLRESEDSVRAWEADQELIPSLFDNEAWREVSIYCRIHKIVSRPHREELRAKIQQAIIEVKETKEYVVVRETGVLDCLVFHRSKPEKFVKTLTKKLGMKREISGPPVTIDEVKRLKATLRTKARAKQLPQDKPGVLVVFGKPIYFGSAGPFYEDLVYEIEETIYDQGNLILGVIIISIGGQLGGVSRVYQKPNYILSRKSHNYLQTDVIVIKNRYSKFPINEKIVMAFVS